MLPAAPSRLVAIGDLHGDLGKARRAFRAAGLTDDKDKWIAGDTVCVQVRSRSPHRLPASDPRGFRAHHVVPQPAPKLARRTYSLSHVTSLSASKQTKTCRQKAQPRIGGMCLAQVGDILDRGDAEIRTLYFLESLQAQARAAGGALHVLNGK